MISIWWGFAPKSKLLLLRTQTGQARIRLKFFDLARSPVSLYSIICNFDYDIFDIFLANLYPDIHFLIAIIVSGFLDLLIMFFGLYFGYFWSFLPDFGLFLGFFAYF